MTSNPTFVASNPTFVGIVGRNGCGAHANTGIGGGAGTNPFTAKFVLGRVGQCGGVGTSVARAASPVDVANLSSLLGTLLCMLVILSILVHGD